MGKIRHERVRRLTLRHGLGDGEVEGCGNASGISYTTRCSTNEARNLLCIVAKAHLRALAVCRRVVESERQAIDCFRKRLCASSIAAPRAALKQGYCFLQRQHVKRDLIGLLAPIREPGRDQHARAGGWQKVCYGIWRGDIVVDKQPCRALFCQSA